VLALALVLAFFVWICLVATLLVLVALSGRPRPASPKGGVVVKLDDYRPQRGS